MGNTRVMFSDLNEDGLVDATEILQENHYYPFGLNMEGEWCAPTNGVENLYQYNGKELNEDFGLGWNDYPEQSGQVGARWYDAASCRFTTVDPMIEKYNAIGGFVYVANNPMIFIDPDGMELIVTFDSEEAEKMFFAEVNKMFGGQFELTKDEQPATDEDGNEIEGAVTLCISNTENGGDYDKLSEGAQAFYRGMKKAVDAPEKIEIGVVHGRSDVDVGKYATGEIDIADVVQFPQYNHDSDEQEGPTTGGKIIHEIHEQYLKAKEGEKFTRHHGAAMGMEDLVNQNERLVPDLGNTNKGVTQRFKNNNTGKISNYKISNYSGRVLNVQKK